MFDINTAEDYFYHLKRATEKYKLDKNKKIERLFFILMGLNHLREWIASEKTVTDEAKLFAEKIFQLDDFETIRNISNGIKHLRYQKNKLDIEYNLTIDEWDNFDDIQNIDLGPPSDFYVNDKNIIEVIDSISDYYQVQWFDKHIKVI